jgi:hypothetical protein
MNSAVERKMKRKLVPTTAFIHIFSRRCVHSARRRSAGVALAASVTGATLVLRRIIRPARASMVTKKKKSLRTMGPMSRISVSLEGSTPVSLSSLQTADDELKGRSRG